MPVRIKLLKSALWICARSSNIYPLRQQLDPIMDEFAQTRAPDDLFDDDFTPIVETVTQNNHLPPSSRANDSEHSPQYSQPIQPNRPYQNQQKQPSRRNERSDADLRRDTGYTTPAKGSSKSQATHATDPEVIATEKENSTTEASAQISTPVATDLTGQRSMSQPKPPSAVRGDRTATGGVAKPKLTEEELSAKLAAVRLKNAKISEAHRLAEADEASFHQREARASQKRAKEGAARLAMNSEREKNRIRKLGAQAGRKWDEGKEEERPERGSQYRRGAHGGVAFGRDNAQSGHLFQVSEQENGQSRGVNSSRGRGGRGGRSRGGGRGGSAASDKAIVQSPPDPIADFPALPTSSKTGDWAEEMQEAKNS